MKRKLNLGDSSKGEDFPRDEESPIKKKAKFSLKNADSLSHSKFSKKQKDSFPSKMSKQNPSKVKMYNKLNKENNEIIQSLSSIEPENKKKGLKSNKKEKLDRPGHAPQDKKNLEVIVDKKVKKKKSKNKKKSNAVPKVEFVEAFPKRKKNVDSSHTLNDIVLKTKINDALARVSKCTLTLKNIPYNCTMPFLMSLIPDMSSCVLPYNPLTRKLKRIAFVEFADESQVKKYEKYFKKNVRGLDIKTSPYNVCCRADDLILNKLIVRGLSKSATKPQLSELFPKAKDIWIMKDYKMDKRVPKMATLTFNSVSDAFECFESHRSRKERILLSDRPLSIQFAPNDKIKRDMKKLCVYDLNNKLTDDILRSIFPQASTIERLMNGHTYLSYTDEEDCKIDRERGLRARIDGKKLHVYNAAKDKAMKDIDNDKSVERNLNNCALFVKNLDKRTTEEEIKSIFPKSNNVEMRTHKNNQCSGHCIVHFVNKKDAKEALTSCQNRLHRKKAIHLSYAKTEENASHIKQDILPNTEPKVKVKKTKKSKRIDEPMEIDQ